MDNIDEKKLQVNDIIEQYNICVDVGQSPIRIDKFIACKISHFSRSKLQNLIDAGMVEVNGTFVKSNYKVRPKDDIVIYAHKEDSLNELLPDKVDFEIVYEDDDILVVNKPAGIVVHPGVGNYRGTLLNGVLHYYLSKGEDDSTKISRLGMVHRIDKQTSGLLVLAKNDQALSRLSLQFVQHSIHRKYQAIVWGDVQEQQGIVKNYIARDPRKRQNFYVTDEEENGKLAITYYKVLERLRYVTYMECQLETGRTHQIRVHMKHMGHTVFQDDRYGGTRILKGTLHKRYKHFTDKVFQCIQRQALHAKELGFVHPRTKKEMFFDSKLPNDMQKCLNMWREYIH